MPERGPAAKVPDMRWPRRGILIRLAIYVPLITILAWRASGGCSEEQVAAPEADDLDQKLAPHRRVITLPDGTQQDIVELTPAEAEAILGHPIPERLDPSEAKAEAKPSAGPGQTSASASVESNEAKAGSEAEGPSPTSGGDGADAAAK